MRKKKEGTIKMVCEECGCEAEPNQEKSNENWAVIDNKPCVKCGGKLIFSIKGWNR